MKHLKKFESLKYLENYFIDLIDKGYKYNINSDSNWNIISISLIKTEVSNSRKPAERLSYIKIEKDKFDIIEIANRFEGIVDDIIESVQKVLNIEDYDIGEVEMSYDVIYHPETFDLVGKELIKIRIS